jgi:hypothetical protein
MELDFGHVGEHVPSIEDISGTLAFSEFGA